MGNIGRYGNISSHNPDALALPSDDLSHHICTAGVVSGLKFASALFAVSLSVMKDYYKCMLFLIFLAHLLRIKVAHRGCIYLVLCRYVPVCSAHSVHAAGCADLVCVQCFQIGGRESVNLAVKDHSEVPRAGPSPELVLRRDSQESWGKSSQHRESDLRLLGLPPPEM